ncbi:hypothetical protein M432DRAFT_612440 [Thermoascus aurantiacus ATCC 26904]
MDPQAQSEESIKWRNDLLIAISVLGSVVVLIGFCMTYCLYQRRGRRRIWMSRSHADKSRCAGCEQRKSHRRRSHRRKESDIESEMPRSTLRGYDHEGIWRHRPYHHQKPQKVHIKEERTHQPLIINIHDVDRPANDFPRDRAASTRTVTVERERQRGPRGIISPLVPGRFSDNHARRWGHANLNGPIGCVEDRGPTQVGERVDPGDTPEIANWFERHGWNEQRAPTKMQAPAPVQISGSMVNEPYSLLSGSSGSLITARNTRPATPETTTVPWHEKPANVDPAELGRISPMQRSTFMRPQPLNKRTEFRSHKADVGSQSPAEPSRHRTNGNLSDSMFAPISPVASTWRKDELRQSSWGGHTNNTDKQ